MPRPELHVCLHFANIPRSLSLTSTGKVLPPALGPHTTIVVTHLWDTDLLLHRSLTTSTVLAACEMPGAPEPVVTAASLALHDKILTKLADKWRGYVFHKGKCITSPSCTMVGAAVCCQPSPAGAAQRTLTHE